MWLDQAKNGKCGNIISMSRTSGTSQGPLYVPSNAGYKPPPPQPPTIKLRTMKYSSCHGRPSVHKLDALEGNYSSASVN